MTQGVTGDQTTTAGHSSVEGNSGNPSSIPVMSMSQGVDYSHPLFLSPADISGVNLISFQLTGIENYALWSRSIKLALLGRNKIGLVDGSCKQEDVSAELRGQWESVNAIVLSWLLNSVSKSLLGGVAFASSAQSVGMI